MTLKEEDPHAGFSTEQIERYRREVRERYDPVLVEESERRVKRMSSEQWQAFGVEGACDRS